MCLLFLEAQSRKRPEAAMFIFDPKVSSVVEAPHPPSEQPEPQPSGPLSADLLAKMHRYWQAANYLTVGQIYLRENPLLREPLRLEHIKPRLLGHWGTWPGLSFIYVHLNRLIKESNGSRKPPPSANARILDAKLQARNPFRRRRKTCGGLARRCPEGLFPSRREPPLQRWALADRSFDAGFRELCARGSCARPGRYGAAAQARRISARRDQAQSRQLPPFLPRRNQFKPSECGFRSDQPVQYQ